ncbi:MAG: hypothetical protein ACXACA_02305, partial [Candidatus Ranarchaeia archaeon]
MSSDMEVSQEHRALRSGQRWMQISIALWLGYWFHVFQYTFLRVYIHPNGILSTSCCPPYIVAWPTFGIGFFCPMMLCSRAITHPFDLFFFHAARSLLFFPLSPLIGYLGGAVGYKVHIPLSNSSSNPKRDWRSTLRLHLQTSPLNFRGLQFLLEILGLTLVSYLLFVTGFGPLLLGGFLIYLFRQIGQSLPEEHDISTSKPTPKPQLTSTQPPTT